MKGKMRSFVCSLATAAIVGTVVAPTALAEEFTAEGAPETVIGSSWGTHVINTNAGSIRCMEASFEGQAEFPISELSLSPSYSSCSFLGISGVTLETGKCSYGLHANGGFDIAGAECLMQITASGCTVKIPSQWGLSTLSYINRGSGSERFVEMEFYVPSIEYTQSLLCPNGQGTFNNGVYFVGPTDLEAFNLFFEQRGLWVG